MCLLCVWLCERLHLRHGKQLKRWESRRFRVNLAWPCRRVGMARPVPARSIDVIPRIKYAYTFIVVVVCYFNHAHEDCSRNNELLHVLYVYICVHWQSQMNKWYTTTTTQKMTSLIWIWHKTWIDKRNARKSSR